ncbi:MAG: Rv1535 family protein [Mycobacterium sp.]
MTRRIGDQLFGAGGDPLVDGTARLLSIPVRHVYAALWRVGVLEVQG